MTQEMGLKVRILLKSGGVLLPQYEALAKTTVLDNLSALAMTEYFKQTGCQHAIFSTSVTGNLLQAARRAGLHCVSLVHEMPSLIQEYSLQPHVNEIARAAHHVVFPSERVRAGFESFEPSISGSITIQPQGLYKTISRLPDARERIRKRLHIGEQARLILNAGYADYRKGFDLFALTALRMCKHDPDLHFCWLGKRTHAMTRWLKSGIARQLKGRLHLIDFSDDMELWYSAADCVYLASREDPFPSVVLEALSIGLPVLLHQDATGFDDSILSLVEQVPIEDTGAVDHSLSRAMREDTPELRHMRQHYISEQYPLSRYARILVKLSGMPLSDELDALAANDPTSDNDQAPDTIAANG